MIRPAAWDLGSLRAPLLAKLARFVDLSEPERCYLESLQTEFQTVRAGADIVTAGHSYRCLFVLNKGFAIRYTVLHDGRRQVLNLILPGDFVGLPGCMFERSLYSIATLGEAVVCCIAFPVVFDLFKAWPRLGTAMFWLAGHEGALFAEHLVGVGRRSAYERVAALLLELLYRLRSVGLGDARSYALPMTQELMADALGLSVPHVNRTLRRLREDRLIAVDGGRLTCLDVEALSRAADFDGNNLWTQRIPGL
jgi:CRP-like cAMP-binding protein